MAKGNRKFVENSLKAAFIRRLERLGIDPQTVDLSVYDWHSFETIDDLLRFYARHGDPICQKLLPKDEYVDDYMEKWAHEYKNYLESLEADDPVKRLEKLEADLDTIYKRIISLESKIEPLDLRAITEQIEALKSELMAIKSCSTPSKANIESPQVHDIIKEIRKDLEDKIEKLKMRIEELAPKPNRQLTLTSMIEAGKEVAEDLPLIELEPETGIESRPEKRPSGKETGKRKSSGAGLLLLRVTIVHLIGLWISWIIYDMAGISMFFTYLTFIGMAWLDTIVWLSRSGPSRRGFATGYMMSQYTNPYKFGRGR